jgi:multiple sugar transport system substrate-binding protein
LYRDEKKINLEITIFPPDQFQQKIEASLTGGTAGDIIFTSPIELYTRCARGWFVSLQAYIDAEIDMEDFFPQTLQYLDFPEQGGDFYGLPRDWVVQVITYNKDLFDEAGIEYPSDGWTWDDLREKAKALTKEEDGKIVQYGLNPFGRTVYRPKLWSEGGQMIADDRSESYFDEPVSIESLQFMTDMLLQDKSITPSAAFPKGVNPFATGKVAMTIPWCCNQTVGNDIGDQFAWDIEVLPKGSKGLVNYGGPDVIALSYSSKHRDEAWQCMKFIATDERTAFFFADRPGFLPFSKAIWNSPDVRKAFNCPSYERVMLKAADHIKAEYTMGFQQWQGDVLAKAIEAVGLEKMSPEEAMKFAKEETDKVLAEWYG